MLSDGLPRVDDYAALFARRAPMIDVRAPLEHRQGAFPGAQNLPLMDDADRHAIGIEYKKHGQAAALALGKKRVRGAVLRQRLDGWQRFIERYPRGVLFCFRGGLRSQIAQRLIYDNTGVAYPRVAGGYKAMRRYLLERTAAAVGNIPLIVLGGRTGVGKTALLRRIRDKIDLEAIYRHRGSAFGAHADGQPSQIDAEHGLAIELLALRRRGAAAIVVEDESAHIGSRTLPLELRQALGQAPLVLLEADDERRVDCTVEEYVAGALAEYRRRYGRDAGVARWSAWQFAALDKLRKRLGGVRHARLREQLERALERYLDRGETGPYRQWIHGLLVDYYDPMYDYQLAAKRERVVFRGAAAAALEFLRDEYGVGLL